MFFKLIIIIIYFILISFVENRFTYTTDRLCDSDQLDCIQLKECKSIFKMVNDAPKPLSTKIANELRKITCGFDRDEPKVCCDNDDVSETTSAPPEHNSISEITITKGIINDDENYVDISQHPNLKFLNLRTCGPFETIDKISGGNVTGLSQYPWMTLLQYKSDDNTLQFKCGGSLINDKYVLTAAHCVTDLSSSSTLVAIRLGEHDVSKDMDCQTIDNDTYCAPAVQDITIEKVIIHQNYNSYRFQNDIALIKLKSPANITVSNVRPVCLPVTEKLQNSKLRKLKVIGWGITENARVSDELLEANVPFVATDDCQKIFGRSITLTPAHLCAGGERGIDSCKGDSGGPLVFPGVLTRQQFIQYGIVSVGGNACSLESVTPGIYTNVSYYMKWILDQLD